MAGPERPPPRWPSPTARTPQPRSPSAPLESSSSSPNPESPKPESPSAYSAKTVMEKLLKDARASAPTPTPTPTAPPLQPTLQDLLNQSNRTTQLQQTLITNPSNHRVYKIQNIIGSSSGGYATVYNGVYCVNDANELLGMQHYDIYITVKVTDTDDREEYEKLVDQINRSRQLDHPNLLRIKDDMIHEDRHYLVFLSMDGSLRSLLKSVYTNGIPEDLVAIVLKDVLEALANLHEEGHLHQELHAGHIYYKLSIPAIKIGFLSTIYEHNSGDDGQAMPGNLPVSQICEWGAAPEIYHLNGEYTEKSDVWLVGIAALELVFGGIQVEDREGLEFLIAKAKSGKGKAKAKVKAMGKYIKNMVMKMNIGKSGSSSSSKRKKVTLSRAFKGMLASCLTEDAGERPTAAALLQHDFFKICDGVFDVYDFRNAVLEAKAKIGMPAGTSSGSNVAATSGSNVIGPSSESNVADPSGSNVADPSSESNVAGPSTGGNEIEEAKP